MNDNDEVVTDAMWHILNGFYKVCVVRAFVELGLADKIDSGIRGLTTLAEAADVRVEPLGRLLRAATALGLCAVGNNDQVSLTLLGDTLRSGRHESMAEWAMFVTAPWIARPWLELASSMRTGRSAFPVVHGTEIWQYFTNHPKDAKLFHAMMAISSTDRAHALRNAVDLSEVRVLVDVGGGHGQLLAVLLGDFPGMRGILADRYEVLPGAMEYFEAVGVADRVELISTNFFTAVPAGGDAYVLSRIIHDWPDHDVHKLLRECREAMRPEARLYIIERVVPHEGEISESDQLEYALEDLDMLVLLGGKERTAPEIERLLRQAGFEGARLIGERGCAFNIIEAYPA